MKKQINFLLLLLTVTVTGIAQPLTGDKIPLSRQYFHETIQATQKKILQMDRKDDAFFTPTGNETLNHELTIAVTTGVDDIRAKIEKDSLLDNNNKIKFLRGLNEALTKYAAKCRTEGMRYSLLTELLTGYTDCMILERDKQSIENNIAAYPYEISDILINTIAFNANPGIDQCKSIVLLKYCDKYRQKAMSVLNDNPGLPFTDSLVSVIARRDPESVYTYAAATNRFASTIRNNPDKLVQVISQMAQMKSGRQMFPFLDNIYREKVTFDEVAAAMNDDVKYYKLLVQTAIDYADRLRQRDTALALESLTLKLEKKAIDPFINTINGLHDISDERIRFKILEPLNAQELYYMAVLGEEVIYTSSYVKGVYPRVWQRMKSPRGDSLLMSVRFDHFKKWIKMAANYNTLDDFLKRMDRPNAQLLMKAFVNGLDKTGSLEDAVDVANSYASINDSALQQLILQQVKANLKQATAAGNKRATDIYGVLNTLFMSMDTTNNIDVAQTLGIPPAYFMPNKSLQDEKGRIIVQQFFYGDKDGQTVFNGFLNSMNNANWKATYAAEWVSISSTKGTPITVYANKPLDESKSLDAKAQANLGEYLENNDLKPTVVIHRGHSYWLPSTIDQLVPSAEVILLGSCGAYQSLNKILNICPAAQIVASKQTGSGLINHPMIYTILESLRQGQDLNWPQLWKVLTARLGDNDLFDDYIPPHKNLGALFLMAYQKKQEQRSDTASN